MKTWFKYTSNTLQNQRIIMNSALRTYMKICNSRGFHKCNSLLYFYEPKRYDLPTVYDNLEQKKETTLDKLRNGCRQLVQETSLLLKEIRTKLRIHPTVVISNEEDILWKFNEGKKSRNEWIVTCDSDYEQGYSTAKLEISPRGTGVFHGTLTTRIPKDGKIVRAGYCNITTVVKFKSFKRETTLDWGAYNCLVLRVRGDGRCYMLNILHKGYVDLFWYDTYHYVLYTRGGPYWQYVKIPFSKFFFGGKGTIQDRQSPMPENTITNFGITLGDKKEGPFRLEIDYIGVCYDPNIYETFAYEMYDMKKEL
ncbi:complex I intermediate-associated protein 30, mitochondrial [Hylaeus anthracinus]|uniref:complex I intermediate-associated protein 30, mitochondrial n=1 Tax=Hylaeus anthracinus TaxID=313031 RepID=UPI0023B99AD8|nr:complex I intermediate-associated protein 30, mitochondrial [Hylaeus anthracinus]